MFLVNAGEGSINTFLSFCALMMLNVGLYFLTRNQPALGLLCLVWCVLAGGRLLWCNYNAPDLSDYDD